MIKQLVYTQKSKEKGCFIFNIGASGIINVLYSKEMKAMDFLSTMTLLYRVPALLIALTFHEYAHAFVSTELGDPTPGLEGRLTMNPLRHLDIIGTLLLVICGFGWAKPVDVDPRYYKNPRSGMLAVSLAGPGMNLLLGLISIILIGFMERMGLLSQGGYLLLYWVMLYNVWFAFFNLIPVPPLDGSKVLAFFLPGDLAWKYENWNARYGFVIMMAVVFSGLVNKVIDPIANAFISASFALVSIIL